MKSKSPPNTNIIIVTLNLLNDKYKKIERLELAIAEIKNLNPDIVLFQEVDLESSFANKLVSSLGDYNHNFASRPGKHHQKEGLAIFSKQEILDSHTLYLDKQHRIAQLVKLRMIEKELWVANCHMHWSLLSDKTRLRHINKVIKNSLSPMIIAGDFNAVPKMKSIELLFANYNSSFKHNPSPTYPTLLRRHGPRASIRRLAVTIGGLLSGKGLKGWQGTIDYIFIDKSLEFIDIDLVFSHATSGGLWPSDHFGLSAKVSIKNFIDKEMLRDDNEVSN